MGCAAIQLGLPRIGANQEDCSVWGEASWLNEGNLRVCFVCRASFLVVVALVLLSAVWHDME